MIEGRDFFLLQEVQTGTEANPNSYSVRTMVFFTGVKGTGRDADHRLRVVEWGNSNFSGAFAKLRKATISLAMSAGVLCVFRTEQLGSHWKDFHEISYLSIFRKFDRNNDPFT